MATVFLGIGSNIGDRQKQCQQALEHLQKNGLQIISRSSLYETEPWGKKEQPWFLNMAIEGTTDHSPHALLALIKKIEIEMGREKTLTWGPRCIDIDILLFDDIILNEHELVIPHPLMHEREFVLRPLSEIAPDKTHPVLMKLIKDLLQEVVRRNS
jgi:2-amino-4-hydroxy-6-hydroxymethyldihydropteridine diphosphokinase